MIGSIRDPEVKRGQPWKREQRTWHVEEEDRSPGSSAGTGGRAFSPGQPRRTGFRMGREVVVGRLTGLPPHCWSAWTAGGQPQIRSWGLEFPAQVLLPASSPRGASWLLTFTNCSQEATRGHTSPSTSGRKPLPALGTSPHTTPPPRAPGVVTVGSCALHPRASSPCPSPHVGPAAHWPIIPPAAIHVPGVDHRLGCRAVPGSLLASPSQAHKVGGSISSHLAGARNAARTLRALAGGRGTGYWGSQGCLSRTPGRAVGAGKRHPASAQTRCPPPAGQGSLVWELFGDTQDFPERPHTRPLWVSDGKFLRSGQRGAAEGAAGPLPRKSSVETMRRTRGGGVGCRVGKAARPSPNPGELDLFVGKGPWMAWG